jgi:UPF0755 protein
MKQRLRPTLIVRFAIFFIAVAMMVIVGTIWWHDGISPVEPSDSKEYPFTIAIGEPISDVAARLSVGRFIRSRTVFYLYIKYQKLDGKIQAGNFILQRSMDLPTLVHELTVGITDIRITTLEGWRNEEIAGKLSSDLGIPEEEFLSYAQLGYMFPDTYSLPKNATAAAVVVLFRETFNKRLTDVMRKDIAQQGRTVSDVVVLASLLEREGKSDDDRPIIAGILLKRMKAGWPLDIDATLQFALGYQPGERSWWKSVLTTEDKKIDSPYNTYRNLGLPPGPISNPGLSSLNAAIYPKDSPYWFYIHDPQGQIHYAKTQAEQDANVARYLTY